MDFKGEQDWPPCESMSRLLPARADSTVEMHRMSLGGFGNCFVRVLDALWKLLKNVSEASETM